MIRERNFKNIDVTERIGFVDKPNTEVTVAADVTGKNEINLNSIAVDNVDEIRGEVQKKITSSLSLGNAVVVITLGVDRLVRSLAMKSLTTTLQDMELKVNDVSEHAGTSYGDTPSPGESLPDVNARRSKMRQVENDLNQRDVVRLAGVGFDKNAKINQLSEDNTSKGAVQISNQWGSQGRTNSYAKRINPGVSKNLNKSEDKADDLRDSDISMEV